MLLLATTGMALAQAGMDLNWTGSGVRAKAMGRAFIGVADDASAITWNPAGLINSLDPQVSFSGTYTAPKANYQLSYSGLDGGEYNVDHNTWTINYASFLAPVRIKGHQFSAAVAYNKVSEITLANLIRPGINEQITRGAVVDTWDSTVVSNLEQYSDGSIDVINLGFGTYIWKDLAFGASANIYVGTTDEGYDLVAEWTKTVGFQNPELRRRLFRAHALSEKDFTGFNITLGLQYTFDNLRMGAVLKTPFELKEEFDIVQNDTVWETMTEQYVILDFTDDFFLTDNKVKYEIPLTLGFGLAYNITPDFLVSADVEWRRFGKSESSVLDSGLIKSSGDKEEYYTDSPLNYYNAGEGRIGFEYKMNTESGIIPLRGGFRYVQDYARDIDSYRADYERTARDGIFLVSTYTVPDERITGYGFSAGTGIHWSSVWLDLAFEYYTDTRSYLGQDAVGDFEADDKYTRSSINLGFTGYF